MSISSIPGDFAGADASRHPVVHQTVSLYYRNDSENSDKEYHLQLLEQSSENFLVNFQYGKRGSRLREGTKTASGVGRRTAQNMFEFVRGQKKQEGYKEIDLSRLAAIYIQMSDHQMDAGGVDLYMDRRGRLISMVEYAKQAGAAAASEFSHIAAYAAARAAREFLVQEMGLPIEHAQVCRGLSIVSRQLTQSGLEDMGVFVGYLDNGQIYRGIPVNFQPTSRPAP